MNKDGEGERGGMGVGAWGSLLEEILSGRDKDTLRKY